MDISQNAFGLFQILFLIVFSIWAVRLTLNWVKVFTDFSYEDWRYKKYREESPKLLWPFVNFFGIHFMPTVLVFLGMLPIYEIVRVQLGICSLLGIVIMLCGILLEYFADKAMHYHLANVTKKELCRIIGSLKFWKV